MSQNFNASHTHLVAILDGFDNDDDNRLRIDSGKKLNACIHTLVCTSDFQNEIKDGGTLVEVHRRECHWNTQMLHQRGRYFS